MEGLFLGGASSRRRFLYRIVFNFNHNRAKKIATYKHFMRERNKILSQGDFVSQGSWLTTLEEKMTVEADCIERARKEAIAARNFADCIEAIRSAASITTIEVLNPDFLRGCCGGCCCDKTRCV